MSHGLRGSSRWSRRCITLRCLDSVNDKEARGRWNGSLHGLEVTEEVAQVPGFLQEPNSQWPKDLSLGSASQITTGGHSQAFSIWALGSIQHPKYSKCYRKKIKQGNETFLTTGHKILPVMSRAIFRALETVRAAAMTIWCSHSRHKRLLSQRGAFELVGNHCQSENTTSQMDCMARGGDLTLRAIITPTLMENRPSPPSLLSRGFWKLIPPSLEAIWRVPWGKSYVAMRLLVLISFAMTWLGITGKTHYQGANEFVKMWQISMSKDRPPHQEADGVPMCLSCVNRHCYRRSVI